MPTDVATFVQYALPVVGLVVGWFIKNRLPAMPNGLIPAILTVVGGSAGLWLFPGVGVERCIALTLGATVAKELYGVAAPKKTP